MPTYQYTGTEPRYYPGLGLHAKPADDQGPTVAEFEPRPPAPAAGEPPLQQPDGVRWVPDDGRWEPSKKKPTAPAVPAESAPADVPAGTGQKEA